MTASTGSLYWRLEEGIKRLEQETGSVMGADGSLFAVRRSLHKAPPDHIIDDMFVSFWVLIQGYRIVQSKDARAYEESASNASDEFGRKARIACQAFNVHRMIWPHIRKLNFVTVYKYVSHKLLRWLCIYFLALSGVFLSQRWPLPATRGPRWCWLRPRSLVSFSAPVTRSSRSRRSSTSSPAWRARDWVSGNRCVANGSRPGRLSPRYARSPNEMFVDQPARALPHERGVEGVLGKAFRSAGAGRCVRTRARLWQH